MSSFNQRSFAGGELAPSLYARVDTSKYATGLRTCRNMMVMRHGGVQNRPGTKFICEVKDSDDVGRLIPFQFNSSQTYVLEFGDFYMRVIKDGVQQTTNSQSITAATQADPCVITYSGADSYSNGDEVTITGIVGMTELNGRNFKVANVDTGANTFELQDMTGTDLDATGYTAYASGGTVSKVYELTTPWAKADLFELNYVQSGDIITVVHPDYSPREIARTGDTTWTITEIDFIPNVSAPTGFTATGGAAGQHTRYMITAVNIDGEESYTGVWNTDSISGITQANPCVVTATGHSVQTYDVVRFDSIVGMTELNGKEYEVTATTANTITLGDVDSTSFTAYSSGGNVSTVGKWITNSAAGTSGSAKSIRWTATDGAVQYNIYKDKAVNSVDLSGKHGFIGVSRFPQFADPGLEPDYTDIPTTPYNPFEDTDNYPSAVTYAQQRRIFANTNNDTEKIWLSRTGSYANFTYRRPIQNNDSFSLVVAGRQVNQVKHMVDIGQLLVLTSGGEWSIQGDASGTITPTDPNPKQYSYNGSGNLAPLIVGGNALYVQARGSIIRDLSFDYTVEGYRGNDLTIFSAHLFDEYTLADWTYQQIPHSIVWAARSDGTLLGLTYVREHQMWAWHKHDFQSGVVESTTTVAEGNEDSVYLLIKRTINGRTTRYIEKMTTRQISESAIEDAIFMDSALSYDGTHTGATTMTLSGGTNWTYDETLTLTASASTFTSAYEGNQIHLTDSSGNEVRFEIDSYSSGTVVTGRPVSGTVPASMQGTAAASWQYAVKTVTGLWHLEGEDVAVFADGFVAGSPNNASYDTVTVANGSITLDRAYAVIHAGLPYISDIETLDIDTPQGETMADKKKLLTKVSMFTEESRGMWVGSKPPTSDATDPLEGLYELKLRENEDYDSPVELKTDVVEINIKPEWNSNGRVFIRQVDPVPMAILAVVPSGLFPIRGG